MRRLIMDDMQAVPKKELMELEEFLKEHWFSYRYEEVQE